MVLQCILAGLLGAGFYFRAAIKKVVWRLLGRKPEPELDVLSSILRVFNDQFGNIEWEDADRIREVIAREIPAKVSSDRAYQNAMENSDKAAARLEHDRALRDVVIGMLSDHTELFKQFSDNDSFKKWLSDTVFLLTYAKPGPVGESAV